MQAKTKEFHDYNSKMKEFTFKPKGGKSYLFYKGKVGKALQNPILGTFPTKVFS